MVVVVQEEMVDVKEKEEAVVVMMKELVGYMVEVVVRVCEEEDGLWDGGGG